MVRQYHVDTAFILKRGGVVKMYFVFSDVHGCLNEMNELLKHWDRKNEKLVFLGDMVDRGYNSYGVIKKLMDLKAKHDDQVIILRGNHDDEFLKWLLSSPLEQQYYYNDTLHETLRSFYHNNPKKFRKDSRRQRADYIRLNYPKIINFLRSLPYYHETEHCIFVHAGIDMTNPNWRNDTENLLWIRDKFHFSPIISDKRIFVGHTPTRLLNNDKTNNNIWISENGDKVVIDGGCVFGGQLNGLKIEENGQIKEIIKIEKKAVLNQAN